MNSSSADKSCCFYLIVSGLLNSVLLEAAAINLVGASLPWDAYKLVVKGWNLDYAASAATVNYNPLGSGAGKSRIQQSLVDFAASDSTLSDSDHELYPDLQFIPSIIGAVGVATNIPLVISQLGDEVLVLSSDVIARIFLGQITFWNDTQLVSLNPILADVPNPIQVVVRSGSSGTTESFSRYLNSTSPVWQDLVGVITNYPVGRVGMENFIYDPNFQNIVDYVMSTPYSISYVPCSSFSMYQRGWIADLINLQGQIVSPTFDSIVAAQNGAVFDEYFTSNIVAANNSGSWPISTYSYFILNTSDCYNSYDVVKFLNYYYVSNEVVDLIRIAGFAVVEESTVHILEIVRGLTCNGTTILKPSYFDGRVGSSQTFWICLHLFVSALILASWLQNICLNFRKDMIPTYLWGSAGTWAVLVGPIPWFLSPSPAVCNSRPFLFQCWVFILSFLHMKIKSLYHMASAIEANNIQAISITKSSFHSSLRRLWISSTAQAIFILFWVFVYGIEVHYTSYNELEFIESISCSCNNDWMIIAQCALCAILAADMCYRMGQVLKVPAMQGPKSRSLLIVTVNLANAFVLLVAYRSGYGNRELYDVDYFIFVIIINSAAFGPFMIALTSLFTFSKFVRCICGKKCDGILGTEVNSGDGTASEKSSKLNRTRTRSVASLSAKEQTKKIKLELQKLGTKDATSVVM